ncbi:hypothetical protein EDB81DRAFT_78172 [Dactylonectria macrodidyma]|uniref:Uncharacterized protein n=1 Tax=Dactylonectria macrodidyma TaxID=307937 RepID=A0A9P9IZT6_9HYPO|nr:hypothetical protein EDB81DRAFT_78172 [Dactylonectria macrodidyma]
MAAIKSLVSLSLLTSVLGSPLPKAGHSSRVGFSLKDRALVWSDATCSVTEITDASYRPDVRWNSVDSQSAWSAVANSWNSDPAGQDQTVLPFPMMASNFFHGPEHMNCQDVGDGTCNTMIQCDDTSFPAGYLILNSFVSIHQVHQNRYNGLDSAMNQMQNSMGKFTETFAPQIVDSSQIMREILTSFAFVIGLGSAYSWNTVIKTARIFDDDDWRGVAKDAFNAAVTFAVSTARDHIPTAADLQNDLTEAMGKFVGKWMEAEADYVNKIFSGEVGTLNTLYGLIQDGMQGAVPTGTDLATLKSEAQKIVYTKMIPAAWSVAPGDYSPFILATDNACSSVGEGDLAGHIDDSTAAQTHVCYDNKIFYVVTPEYVNNRGNLVSWKVNPLPGGTYDNLHGEEWGGVTLDDIVISSWDGYKLNGNQNGYQMPDNSEAIDGNGNNGNIIFEAGVRTPGFSTMPICDIDTLTKNLKYCNSNYVGFPCRAITSSTCN